MLSTTAFLLIATASASASSSWTGVLTDNDGYAVNAKLSVDIAASGSASEWKWVSY